MSTSLCQGVQSQFDPWLADPQGVKFRMPQNTCAVALASPCSPRPTMAAYSALELNLHALQHATVKADLRKDLNSKRPAKNGDIGGWSFLQGLSDRTLNSQNVNETVYVHPLAKRSSPVLDEKSLEMCTESLGSETGSTLSENGDDLISSISLSESERSSRMSCYSARKRSINISSLPPPLTTIRNGGSSYSVVRVKSLREDGRLVIDAVTVQTHQSCFKAERRDGRLRLHFHDDSPSSLNSSDNEDAEELNHEEYSQGFNVLDDHETSSFYNVIESDDDGGGESDANVKYADDFNYNHNDNNMEAIRGNLGDEVEVRNFGRCKEKGDGRRGMLNWEPLCVATS